MMRGNAFGLAVDIKKKKNMADEYYNGESINLNYHSTMILSPCLQLAFSFMKILRK